MSHDPTVTAAVITVVGTAVGTVLIAAVGFTASYLTMKRTVKSGEDTAKNVLDSGERNLVATIRGEREHRLWERRTDTYIDVLADTTHRQVVRGHQVRMLKYNEEVEARIQEYLDSFKPDSSWFVLEARLRAYATDTVITAFLASNEAHRAYIEAAEEVGLAAKGPESAAAFTARHAAVDAAREKDEELVRVIRDEIQLQR